MSKFTLTNEFIVVVEKADTPDMLRTSGLNQGDLSLNTPEFVKCYRTADDEIFRIGYLYDNDYMMVFYAPKTALNGEVSAWL